MTSKTALDVKKHLQSVFGKDLEILDAKENLRVQPTAADCEGADPKAPNNCVLVHTVHRMFGAQAAVFWKSNCYVDLIDPKDGRRKVFRFKVNRAALQHIMNLDQGKPFIEGTAIVLRAPTRKQTLKHKRRDNRRYRRTPAGKATMKFNAARTALAAAEARHEAAATKLAEVRESEKPGSPKIGFAQKQERAIKQTVRVAKQRLKDATKHVDSTRRRGRMPPRKTMRFDLTTRNGAAGHYNFVRNDAA